MTVMASNLIFGLSHRMTVFVFVSYRVTTVLPAVLKMSHTNEQKTVLRRLIKFHFYQKSIDDALTHAVPVYIPRQKLLLS